MTTHTIPARDIRTGDQLFIGVDACGRWAGPWHRVIAVRPCTLAPWGSSGPCCVSDACYHWAPRPGVHVLLDHREGFAHRHEWWPLPETETVAVSRPPFRED